MNLNIFSLIVDKNKTVCYNTNKNIAEVLLCKKHKLP
jgi:hypothetical protein